MPSVLTIIVLNEESLLSLQCARPPSTISSSLESLHVLMYFYHHALFHYQRYS